MPQSAVERRETVRRVRIGGRAVIHIRAVGREQLGHPDRRLGTLLTPVLREGEVEDRGPGACDLPGREARVMGERGGHGLMAVERHLEAEIGIRKARVAAKERVHDPALAEIERRLQALGPLVTVHGSDVPGELELGPALEALFAGDHVERVGMLDLRAPGQMPGHAGQGVRFAGKKRLPQGFRAAAQGVGGGCHRSLPITPDGPLIRAGRTDQMVRMSKGVPIRLSADPGAAPLAAWAECSLGWIIGQARGAWWLRIAGAIRPAKGGRVVPPLDPPRVFSPG